MCLLTTFGAWDWPPCVNQTLAYQLWPFAPTVPSMKIPWPLTGHYQFCHAHNHLYKYEPNFDKAFFFFQASATSFTAYWCCFLCILFLWSVHNEFICTYHFSQIEFHVTILNSICSMRVATFPAREPRTCLCVAQALIASAEIDHLC